MGTPVFAVPSLEALIAHDGVVAVFTRPDATSGRGRRTTPSPVKLRAVEAGIPVEQPVTWHTAETLAVLESYGPDLVVVVAYGAILPAEILTIPRLGAVNVHASLLPRWRGAAPIQRAILAGDDCTGVSIMRMEAGLDTGPWCAQVRVPVGDKTADELSAELAHAGAAALMETLPSLADGTCRWTAQLDAQATYASKLTAADVVLDPGLSVTDARRRVRASGSSAPSRAIVGGRRITVRAVAPAEPPVDPGMAHTDAGLVLGLRDGALRVTSLVPEGRSAMAAEDWLRGARLAPRVPWSAP